MSFKVVTKNHIIDLSSPCYVIAEMSANHGGSIERAKKIIREAKNAGANCIKLQTYTADTLTIDCDNDYFNIKEGTWEGSTLHSLYEKAYTPWEWHSELKTLAEEIGLDFLSTPFDKSAVDFLENLNVDMYKIASFEIVDIPLVRYIAQTQKPIIMSTGMSSLADIENAVSVIREEGNENIILLKCSSAYPAIPDDMNLKSMPQLGSTFNTMYGLSDHTLGNVSSIAAAALGARVIEKHFCLSREIATPDSSFSMEPDEFNDMVNMIRETERALGNNYFGVTRSEIKSKVFRKSIFVVEDIEPGEKITEKNIRVIRPGYGLMPMYYDEVIGKLASKKLVRGTPLNWQMVK